MRFEKEMIFTGKEVRQSKKTGNEYTVVKLLDEKGDQISCVAERIQNNIYILDSVLVTFELKVGKYINLKALDVVKID